CVRRTKGQLRGCPAVGRDPEDLLIARLEIACTVGTISYGVDDLQRFGPFRALGLGRCLPKLRTVIGNEHGIGDAPPIRRPGDAVRAVRQPGDARTFPASHPTDIELRTSDLR